MTRYPLLPPQRGHVFDGPDPAVHRPHLWCSLAHKIFHSVEPHPQSLMSLLLSPPGDVSLPRSAAMRQEDCWRADPLRSLPAHPCGRKATRQSFGPQTFERRLPRPPPADDPCPPSQADSSEQIAAQSFGNPTSPELL